MPQDPHPLTPGPAPRDPPSLDSVDRAILDVLVEDGRIPNVALAARVGIAETTCSGRLRALRERGVITGVHAHVDLERIGRPVQALVAVRLAGHDRVRVARFGDEVAALPGVLAAYNVSGTEDFVVHVATATPQTLRDFVLDNLASRDGVTGVETSFVFSEHPGQRPFG